MRPQSALRSDGGARHIDQYLSSMQLWLGAHAAQKAHNIARVEIESAARQKSEFLANMGHELRTPLNAILGFAEFLRSDPALMEETERVEHYLKLISNAGENLLTLIDQILLVSKVDLGTLELKEEALDLPGLICECLALKRPRAEEKRISLRSEVSLGEAPFSGDMHKLRQALTNILSNAICFTPAEGCITVRVYPERDGGAAIEIEDSGNGMAPEDIGRAMMPFTQLDGGLARSHEGAGLGLPIARALIEHHGGTFFIASEPNQGTLVRMSLPSWRFAQAPSTAQTARTDR